MRDSADSYDPAYGRIRRAKGKRRGTFDDDTDGLPEGDRWSTWDQTQNPVPNDLCEGRAHDEGP